MALTSPPALPPSARPPVQGLSGMQKVLIAFCIVLFLGIIGASLAVLLISQRLQTTTRTVDVALKSANDKRKDIEQANNKALRAAASGTLPAEWDCAATLEAINGGEYDSIFTLVNGIYDANGELSGEVLAHLARQLDQKDAKSPCEESIDPLAHSPAEIAANLLQVLKSSTELHTLSAAANLGIYYVEFDMGQSEDEIDVPDREGPGRLLAARALLEAQLGDLESAVTAYLDAVQFALVVGGDPYLSLQPTRYYIEAYADKALWELLDRQSLTPDAEEKISARLAARGDTSRLKELAIEDAALSIVRSIERAADDNPIVQAILSASDTYDPKAMKKTGEEVARLMDLPYPEMQQALSKIDSPESNWIKTQYLRDARTARMAHLRSAEELDAFRVALALKRYKAEHGNYPSLLAELLPTHLETVPIDPITERPMMYLRSADGFFLLAPANRKLDRNEDYYDYYYTSYDDRGILWRARN